MRLPRFEEPKGVEGMRMVRGPRRISGKGEDGGGEGGVQGGGFDSSGDVQLLFLAANWNWTV